MGAVFCANGPDIIPGSRLDSINNVDVYPFIANILGLEIPEIDGDPDKLRSFVKK